MDEHLADLDETLVFAINNYTNKCVEIRRGGFDSVCGEGPGRTGSAESLVAASE